MPDDDDMVYEAKLMCALNLKNNSYFTPFGNASVSTKAAGRQYSVDLAKLIAHGVEEGSTVATLPSNQQIIAWARTKLPGMQTQKYDPPSQLAVTAIGAARGKEGE